MGIEDVFRALNFELQFGRITTRVLEILRWDVSNRSGVWKGLNWTDFQGGYTI